MDLSHWVRVVLVGALWVFGATDVLAQASSRGEESEEASSAKDPSGLSVEIKNRLYKTHKTFELRLQGGLILNNPYLEPMAMHGAATYYLTPNLGLGVDFLYAINTDKNERVCVETFYNTHNHNLGLPACTGSYDSQASQQHLAPYVEGGAKATPPPYPNMGPAYAPIREINMVIAGTLTWLPFYGKILLFMSRVAHTHTFLTLGGGVAMSDFYPEKKTTASGHILRGPTPPAGSKKKAPGVPATNTNEYGEGGRPTPIQETTPTLTLGVGQKFHLSSHIALLIEGRGMFLFGTEDSYEVYFAVWGGLGFST